MSGTERGKGERGRVVEMEWDRVCLLFALEGPCLVSLCTNRRW